MLNDLLEPFGLNFDKLHNTQWPHSPKQSSSMAVEKTTKKIYIILVNLILITRMSSCQILFGKGRNPYNTKSCNKKVITRDKRRRKGFTQIAFAEVMRISININEELETGS